MTIHVQQKHIDNGQRAECAHCPLALAFHDAGLERAMIASGAVSWGINSSAALPAEAHRFYREFDSGLKVKPFTFEIEIP